MHCPRHLADVQAKCSITQLASVEAACGGITLPRVPEGRSGVTLLRGRRAFTPSGYRGPVAAAARLVKAATIVIHSLDGRDVSLVQRSSPSDPPWGSEEEGVRPGVGRDKYFPAFGCFPSVNRVSPIHDISGDYGDRSPGLDIWGRGWRRQEEVIARSRTPRLAVLLRRRPRGPRGRGGRRRKRGRRRGAAQTPPPPPGGPWAVGRGAFLKVPPPQGGATEEASGEEARKLTRSVAATYGGGSHLPGDGTEGREPPNTTGGAARPAGLSEEADISTD